MVFLDARLYTRRLISIATLAIMPKITTTRKIFSVTGSRPHDLGGVMSSSEVVPRGRSFVYVASSTWATEVTAASVDIITETQRCVRWMKSNEKSTAAGDFHNVLLLQTPDIKHNHCTTKYYYGCPRLTSCIAQQPHVQLYKNQTVM